MTKEITLTKREYDNRMQLVQQGIANDIVNELVKVCPVDTGMLKQSIHATPIKNGFEIKAMDYIWFIEYGTPPHLIKPKNAKALHFRTEDQEDVFAKVIHHPGTRPNPIIRNTIHLKMAKIVNDNIKKHLLKQ